MAFVSEELQRDDSAYQAINAIWDPILRQIGMWLRMFHPASWSTSTAAQIAGTYL